MRENFETALKWVLEFEGGCVDHPRDPGGLTCYGITQRTYDRWRKLRGRATQSVRRIGQDELRSIYRDQYWDLVRGDDLPSGLDAAVFDFAVNSGPARAARFLQRLVGVEADGIIGPQTLSAVLEWCPTQGGTVQLIREYCDARLRWLQGLAEWPTFGRGWRRRVLTLRDRAITLARGSQTEKREPDPRPLPTAKAINGVTKPSRATVAKGVLLSRETLTGVGSVIGALGAVANGSGPVQWALAIGLAGLAIVATTALAKRVVRQDWEAQ